MLPAVPAAVAAAPWPTTVLRHARAPRHAARAHRARATPGAAAPATTPVAPLRDGRSVRHLPRPATRGSARNGRRCRPAPRPRAASAGAAVASRAAAGNCGRRRRARCWGLRSSAGHVPAHSRAARRVRCAAAAATGGGAAGCCRRPSTPGHRCRNCAVHAVKTFRPGHPGAGPVPAFRRRAVQRQRPRVAPVERRLPGPGRQRCRPARDARRVRCPRHHIAAGSAAPRNRRWPAGRGARARRAAVCRWCGRSVAASAAARSSPGRRCRRRAAGFPA